MKEIYISCPANSYTGGPTLAHQLFSHLKKKGYKVFMWYQRSFFKRYHGEYVHKNYKEYEVDYVIKKPKDCANNVIVALESDVTILNKFKRCEKIIWWMSVDNYYNNMYSLGEKIVKRLLGIAPALSKRKKHENQKKYRVVLDAGTKHLVQSEYARLFLKGKGVLENNIFPLSDYIEDELLEAANALPLSSERSSKRVLYNPKKGFEFTKRIIEMMPNCDWVPLINMDKKSVANYLKTSKLYIDFGEHPGKDRFPREAVLLGDCIITGKKGAANNDLDIPIPHEYKFDDIDESLNSIALKINQILNNYESEFKNFEKYREIIKSQKRIFLEEIDSFFGKYLS